MSLSILRISEELSREKLPQRNTMPLNCGGSPLRFWHIKMPDSVPARQVGRVVRGGTAARGEACVRRKKQGGE